MIPFDLEKRHIRTMGSSHDTPARPTSPACQAVDISPLFRVIAPAGVPEPVIERLSATLAASVRDGALRDKLAGLGFQPVGSTPMQFAQRIRDDIAMWTGVIRRGGIKAE